MSLLFYQKEFIKYISKELAPMSNRLSVASSPCCPCLLSPLRFSMVHGRLQSLTLTKICARSSYSNTHLHFFTNKTTPLGSLMFGLLKISNRKRHAKSRERTLLGCRVRVLHFSESSCSVESPCCYYANRERV